MFAEQSWHNSTNTTTLVQYINKNPQVFLLSKVEKIRSAAQPWEYFGQQCPHLNGISYDLIFLYLTPPSRSMSADTFLCVGAVESDTGHLVDKISKEYEWMMLSMIADNVDINNHRVEKIKGGWF